MYERWRTRLTPVTACFMGVLCLLPERSAGQDEGQGSTPLVVLAGTLIDGTGSDPTNNAVIVVRDGLIECVGSASDCPFPEPATSMRCERCWVVPGLIDTHIHVGWTYRDSSHRSWRHEQLRLWLENGVTTVREASGSDWDRELVALRDSINRGRVLGPRLWVSGTLSPRNRKRYGTDDVRELVRRLVALGVDGLKIRLGVGPDELDDAIDEAHRLRRSIFVHPGNLGPAVAFTNVDGLMHVDQLIPVPGLGLGDLPGLGQWDGTAKTEALLHVAGARQWLSVEDDAIESLVRAVADRDVWLDPTLRGARPDSIWETHRPFLTEEDRQIMLAAWQRTVEVVGRFHAAGGWLVAGTDYFTPTSRAEFESGDWPTLVDELEVYVLAGLSAHEALLTATANAARALGWDQMVGTVERGKSADLLLLEADPLEDIGNLRKVHTVLARGAVLDFR